jgi:hypothetical protein
LKLGLSFKWIQTLRKVSLNSPKIFLDMIFNIVNLD